MKKHEHRWTSVLLWDKPECGPDDIRLPVSSVSYCLACGQVREWHAIKECRDYSILEE